MARGPLHLDNASSIDTRVGVYVKETVRQRERERETDRERQRERERYAVSVAAATV